MNVDVWCIQAVLRHDTDFIVHNTCPCKLTAQVRILESLQATAGCSSSRPPEGVATDAKLRGRQLRNRDRQMQEQEQVEGAPGNVGWTVRMVSL